MFAGGGALGIEALSRGASEVVFVEMNFQVLRYLRENVRGLEGAAVRRGDASRMLEKLGAEYDIVLADPPYRTGLAQSTLDLVDRLAVVRAGGWLVVEHHRDEAIRVPEGWEAVKQGRYGDSWITVIRRRGDE